MRGFQPDPVLSKELVSNSQISSPISDNRKAEEFEILWRLVDYGWLTDPARDLSLASSGSDDWSSTDLQSTNRGKNRNVILNDMDVEASDQALTTAYRLSPSSLLQVDSLDFWPGVVLDDEAMLSQESGQEPGWNDLVL